MRSMNSLTTSRQIALAGIFSLVAAMSLPTVAAAQAPTPYGEPISQADAKKVLAGAEAEAKKNNWPVAITIVDPSGFLVAFSRLDNTQLGSIEISIEKAKTAAHFRRPTKALDDALAAGGQGLRILKIPGALPLEGGIPIVRDGKIIGAIGVSGVKSEEDAQIAQAGIDALLSGK